MQIHFIKYVQRHKAKHIDAKLEVIVLQTSALKARQSCTLQDSLNPSYEGKTL